MRNFCLTLSLAVLLGGEHFQANAVALRFSTQHDEAELAEETLAELERKEFDFDWAATHDCTWVHRRLRDNSLPSYDNQVALLKEAN